MAPFPEVTPAAVWDIRIVGTSDQHREKKQKAVLPETTGTAKTLFTITVFLDVERELKAAEV